ncbi:MAG: leucine-rich repeat domain-containing protein [Bacteroidales bacterium]|nr:leucine-rich repeat domain-containing protein [Bacteroidales bacterium]
MKRTLSFLCTLLCANMLFAQTSFWVDSLQYEIYPELLPGLATLTYADNSITTANIPETVNYNGTDYRVWLIAYGAFANCDRLTSVTIPNSVEEFGNNVFDHCSALTSVTIGNGIFSIGENLFDDCIMLQTVTLGSNVNYIGSGAFGNSELLENVTCLSINPPVISDDTAFPNPNDAILTVPCGSLPAYSSANSLWSTLFADRIEEDCATDSGLEETEVENLSFFPNPTKSKITFSQTIENIEVIDLTGKTILTFSNAKTIDIDALPSGTYYLRLTDNEKTTLRKVIKQ